MPSEAAQQQIFVRNDRGRLWGPITLETLELLLENGHIEGRIQVSFDGLKFGFPGRFPEVRKFVPPSLWGPGFEPPVPGPPVVIAGPGTRAPATPRPPAPPPPPPTAPNRIELAPTTLPPEGDLAKVSPLRLYYLAAAGDETGLLTLQGPDCTFEIHFRKGNPEYVGSSHPEDAVAGFLLRQKLVTIEQLTLAQEALPRFGGDVVGALFGIGVLSPSTAFSHLVQRAQSILIKALMSQTGRFTWRREELPPHKAMSLGNRWAVLMELMRKVPPLVLRHRLADVVDNPVMKSGGQVSVQDLRLTPQEMRAIGFIDGVRSLNLLARDLPQDADHFLRLAFVLREMDIVAFAAAKLPTPETVAPPPVAADPVSAATAAPTPPPVVAPVRPAPPRITAPPPTSSRPVAPSPAAPAAPVDFDAELKTVRELLERAKGQNHFEVLGVTDRADAGQVKIAYFKLARTYHPDTVPPSAPPELAQLKADLFARIGEAYRTLSDESARNRYLDELQVGGSEVDVNAILHAEELFQKGCILVKAKKFSDAVEMLTDAIATNPEEGEFYAWRGIARFFAAPDRRQGKGEADRDIAHALGKNPRCAPAFYFQGQMSKLLGDTKAAEKYFKQVLDIQPDHLDAQRELRYLKR